MKAIILAAGVARRLRPLTQSMPKCLLKIGDYYLIDYQLNALSSNGVRDILIVVGYRALDIMAYVTKYYPSLNIFFVYNPYYAKTNTIYSLMLTKNFFENGFLYFNADVLFDFDIVRRLLSNKSENVLAVDFKKCGKEEVKVILEKDLRIKRIGKKIPLDQSAGEFIGVAKFSGDYLDSFAKALESVVSRGDVNTFFETAIDETLSNNTDLVVENTSDLAAVGIDFVEDYERAIQEILPKITFSIGDRIVK